MTESNPPHSLTHSLTHSLIVTHSHSAFAYSHSHSLTHSLTVHSALTHSLSFTVICCHSLTHSQSLWHCDVHSFIHFIRSFVHFVHFVRSLTHSLTHSAASTVQRPLARGQRSFVSLSLCHQSFVRCSFVRSFVRSFTVHCSLSVGRTTDGLSDFLWVRRALS